MGLGQAEPLAACPCGPSTWPPWPKSRRTSLTGATTADMVKAYTEGGWRADAAVLDALAAVTQPPDREAVMGGHRACLHALAAGCRGIVPGASQASSPCQAESAAPGRCAGRHLPALRRWPAVRRGPEAPGRTGSEGRQSPGPASIRRPALGHADREARRFSGRRPDHGLRWRAKSSGPASMQDGKDLTLDRFRKLLEDDGFQVLGGSRHGRSQPAGPGRSSAIWTRPATRRAAGWPVGFPN